MALRTLQEKISMSSFKQVAQLSQRDRAAWWVSYGRKWETIFYGHCRSIFFCII